MMAERLIALVDSTKEHKDSIHFRGFPPELTGGIDDRESLPWPRVVVIEENPDGVFLYRYTEDGLVVGDTWHQDCEEAKEQAAFEYGDLLTEWRSVPPEVMDPIAFALAADA